MAIAVAGTAILAWPYRSTSRAVQGATTAVAASPVAVTAPARAYEPRDPAIMITALTLNIPIGSRAIRLPMVKARAPGVASRRRYGLVEVRRAGAPVRGAITSRSPETACSGVVGVSDGMGQPSWRPAGAVQHLLRTHSRMSVLSSGL